jgi:hypothetical protein
VFGLVLAGLHKPDASSAVETPLLSKTAKFTILLAEDVRDDRRERLSAVDPSPVSL